MVAVETITFATVLKKVEPPRQFLGYLIAHSMKAVTGRLVDNFKNAGHNISKEQWLIMAKAHQFGNQPLNQSDIVAMMLGEKTQVTRAVDDLVKKGWITQEIDQNDRRNRLLKLTELGNEMLPELKKCVEKTLKETTNNINPADMDITKKVLAQIIENSKLLNQ